MDRYTTHVHTQQMAAAIVIGLHGDDHHRRRPLTSVSVSTIYWLYGALYTHLSYRLIVLLFYTPDQYRIELNITIWKRINKIQCYITTILMNILKISYINKINIVSHRTVYISYKVLRFSIATLTFTTHWPELALHCWQLVGKTNVYGTAPTAALHILIASPTSARQDFDPQPQLVLIYRPRTLERPSCNVWFTWPISFWVLQIRNLVIFNDISIIFCNTTHITSYQTVPCTNFEFILHNLQTYVWPCKA